jgi:hypothetical protein
MIATSVVVGRVGVCMLCVCDSEEREHGVGPVWKVYGLGFSFRD